MVLAQVASEAKSYETTAEPKLLEMLSLKATIMTSAFRSRHVNLPKCVTADALNCQREIAQKIVDQGGNHALAMIQSAERPALLRTSRAITSVLRPA